VSGDALATAVVGALDATFPTSAAAFQSDDAPTTLPARYVEVGVSRRYIEEGTRGDGGPGDVGWRISTTCVATRLSDAHRLFDLTVNALDFTTLAVGAHEATVVFETSEQPAPDSGRWVALHTWTCVLPNDNPK
jgi:hypothetical protein